MKNFVFYVFFKFESFSVKVIMAKQRLRQCVPQGKEIIKRLHEAPGEQVFADSQHSILIKIL